MKRSDVPRVQLYNSMNAVIKGCEVLHPAVSVLSTGVACTTSTSCYSFMYTVMYNDVEATFGEQSTLVIINLIITVSVQTARCHSNQPPLSL